ncbi:MAG: SurA N-terminal domain-containing protein [Desulfobacteraceae bacterium]|nr:SurA N-terminal domain-containing protein [Desulfobacteraceae bacterium]
MANKIKALVIILICCIFFTISHAEVIDKIVAIVNEDIITLVELNKAIKPYITEVEKTAYSSEEKTQIIHKLQKDMLTKMIEFQLAEQEAERLNIQVSDEEFQATLERLLKKENLTREELEKALIKEKVTFEEYENEMRSNILRPKLINRVIKSMVVITNEEIEEYYEEHEDQYLGVSKYYLRNILISEKDEIDKVKVFLDQGQDFKKIAQEYSIASNASTGGDLGSFELDVFAENIRESILLLEKGQYTDVISTEGGFQIFFLEKIEKFGDKTLEQANKEISEKLFSVKAEKKYLEWFELLKERSHIKITL